MNDAIEILCRMRAGAVEHNGYLYMLCPVCGKGNIVLKKAGQRTPIIDCPKLRHYKTERAVITHLDEVHRTSEKK